MRRWKITVVEPSLDELLGDEMMISVMRSAGIDAEELRLKLRAAACRRARSESPGGSGDCSRWAVA